MTRARVVSRQGAPSVQGRAEGPFRAPCEVLASRVVGSYHQLTLVAPDIASATRPGQFVSVGVEGGETILRRPFSVAGTSQRGPWAGTLDIVFSAIGPGTEWLARRGKHDIVDVVGPLGRAFPVPRQRVRCLLVGGGYGAAPMVYLAQELQQEGLRVDVVFGAATQERLFNAMEAKRLASTATFATEDGSLGTKGVVTDVLASVIDSTGAGVVYACGPMPMLAAVAQVAKECDVPCQVAVEESMACGVGVCMTCVVPYHRREGLANVRACLEGPVFDAKRVAWDACRAPGMGDPRGAGAGDRAAGAHDRPAGSGDRAAGAGDRRGADDQ